MWKKIKAIIRNPKLHQSTVLLVLMGMIVFSLGYFLGSNDFAGLSINHFVGKGQVLGKDKSLNSSSYLDKDVNFSLMWDVWNTVKSKYIDKDKIKESQMFYGALAGSVAALKDPYSIFMDPKTTSDFNQELSGSLEGIGAEIGIKNDRLTIISPLADSPAEKAGLQPKDFVMAIDGQSTEGLALDVAVSKIRGPKGTKVKLTIVHPGQEKPEDITIVRAKIEIKSVILKEGANYNWLKITHFNENTESNLKEVLNKLVLSRKPIVLDLRNNPGGFLNVAVDLAGYWLDNGQVVVKEQFNQQNLNQTYQAQGRSQLKDIPVIVLVNAGSASASEILAGALQDYGLARLVGEKTFGKGSVQEMTKLKDGSSIKVTIARWLTPKDRMIDKEGIKPDVEVSLSADDFKNNKDPQLDKAIELVTSKK